MVSNDVTAERFSYLRRWTLNAGCLLLSDALVLAFALVLAGMVRFLIKDNHMPPSRGFYLVPTWCLGAILLRLAPCWGLGEAEKLRRTQLLLVTIYGLAAAVLFLSKSADMTSRLKFVLAYAICIPMVPLVRSWMTSILIGYKLWGVPTAVYGSDQAVRQALDIIREEPSLGYMPYGVFEDDEQTPEQDLGIRRLGGMTDYSHSAPFALLGTQSIESHRLQELMDGPLATYRRVIMLPHLFDIPSVWVMARDFNGILGLELVRNLLNPAARFFKWGVEYLLVLLTAPVWLPLLGIIAALLYLNDRHSPFFRQERVGRHGRLFHILKFRTMVPEAERVLEERLQADPGLREEWRQAHKLKEDPRITSLGRKLRKYSLDELPQLLNVLRGEMSLVGPRPLPAYHQQRLSASVLQLREQVLPGVTGLWQISGRSDAGTEGIEKMDAYYVRNWSIWLDLVILAKTCSAVFEGAGAY